MGAVCRRFNYTRARYKAALRPRVPRARCHVVGIEEISEALVEYAIAGNERPQQEVLEEPGDVGAMPFDRARIRHRLHDLIFRTERRRAALGLRTHGAEGVAPVSTRVSAPARDCGPLIGWIKQPNGWQSGRARHRLVRKTGRHE